MNDKEQIALLKRQLKSIKRKRDVLKEMVNKIKLILGGKG